MKQTLVPPVLFIDKTVLQNAPESAMGEEGFLKFSEK